MVKLTKDGILRINYRITPYNDFNLQCNYKCSYCFVRNYKIKQKTFIQEQFLQNKKVWDQLSKIDDKIYVRINFNGELMIDKWAKECAYYINKIPNVKVLEIVTNNSINPNVYLKNFDLDKTSFNCSFHPEFANLKNFIENIYIIKKAGYPVYANLISIPQIIEKLEKIAFLFKKFGIDLRLQGFITQGFKYLGKEYPKDYTNKEREIMKKFYPSKEEYEYLVDLKKTKGLDCYAGVDMINVFLNGVIKRCFNGQVGKILQTKENNKNYFPQKLKKIYGKLINLSLNYKSKYQFQNFFIKDIKIDDLISGKIKLLTEPYPCHENFCTCNAHFLGLKEFRNKYRLSNKFVDNYELQD